MMYSVPIYRGVDRRRERLSGGCWYLSGTSVEGTSGTSLTASRARAMTIDHRSSPPRLPPHNFRAMPPLPSPSLFPLQLPSQTHLLLPTPHHPKGQSTFISSASPHLLILNLSLITHHSLHQAASPSIVHSFPFLQHPPPQFILANLLPFGEHSLTIWNQPIDLDIQKPPCRYLPRMCTTYLHASSKWQPGFGPWAHLDTPNQL